MLQMLEPTTLPTLMSPEPFSAASTLTHSSGALVPNATSVRPITSGGIRSRFAMLTPPRIRYSAP